MVTSFQQQVYDLCSRVPAGRVTTYAEIARAMWTTAYRAVGGALNKNPFATVPCHRVVASDGTLGGFAHGCEAKVRLLKEEGVAVCDGVVIGFETKLFKLT